MVLAADVRLLPEGKGGSGSGSGSGSGGGSTTKSPKKESPTGAEGGPPEGAPSTSSKAVILYEEDDGTAVKRVQAAAGDQILAGSQIVKLYKRSTVSAEVTGGRLGGWVSA